MTEINIPLPEDGSINIAGLEGSVLANIDRFQVSQKSLDSKLVREWNLQHPRITVKSNVFKMKFIIQ